MMKPELLKLQNRLENERQELANRLKQIDDDLTSIKRVINLVDTQDPKHNEAQLAFIETKEKSKKFRDFTFKDAIEALFDQYPGKFWTPKEIVDALRQGSFSTRAKDFGASARTMLWKLREDGEIAGIKTKTSWLYGQKGEDSTSNNVESSNSGDVGERSKPPIL